ncbi:MAG: hypothetical protein AB1483_11590 [Candidatus Zixiibacteriota bacterium]
MLIKRIIVLTIITLVLSSTAFAQGEFLHPGESGLFALHNWGFSERLALNETPISSFEGQESWSVTAGFSYKGITEISLSYRDRDYIQVKDYRATFTYYLKSQKAWGMAGAGLMAGYSSAETANPTPYNSLYWDRNDLVLGVTIFSNYQARNIFAMQLILSGVILTALESRPDGAIAEMRGRFRIALLPKEPIRPFFAVGIGFEDKGGTDTYGTIEAGVLTAF